MDLTNQYVIHQKCGEIEYLQFRRLLQYENKISHCFTLIGKENNYQVNDGRSYSRFMQELGLDYKGLVTIKNQVHSDIVKKVEDNQEICKQIDRISNE